MKSITYFVVLILAVVVPPTPIAPTFSQNRKTLAVLAPKVNTKPSHTNEIAPSTPTLSKIAFEDSLSKIETARRNMQADSYRKIEEIKKLVKKQ